jgi:hypothetical protein
MTSIQYNIVITLLATALILMVFMPSPPTEQITPTQYYNASLQYQEDTRNALDYIAQELTNINYNLNN